MTRLLRAGLALALVLPALLSAQATLQGDAFTTPAHTAWAARGAALQTENLARLGNISRLRAPAPGVSRSTSVNTGFALRPLTGTLRQVMIPVSFRDTVIKFTAAQLSDRFYGAGSALEYSLPKYYGEVSLDRFSVSGTVLPVVALPDSEIAYTGRANGTSIDLDGLRKFIIETLTRADSVTDWAPLADSTDATHRVAAVVFLYAGRDGQCGRAQTGPAIRPHRYTVSQLTGAPFRTHTRMPDGQYVLVDDYIIEGSTACEGGVAHAGTVIHETGHLLGLPDLYNVSTQAGSPVGRWDLMGYGNRGPDSLATGTPSHLGAWSKGVLGWASVTVAAPGPGTQLPETIRHAEGTNEIVVVPMDSTSEYLLVETRQWTGSDSRLPGQGMLFWQVDPTVLASTRATNTVNTSTTKPGVAVVPADGVVSDLGDAGDLWPFPTGHHAFGQTTTPAFRSHETGRGAGYSIDSIGVAFVGTELIGHIVVRSDAAVTLNCSGATGDDLASYLLDGTLPPGGLDALSCFDSFGNKNGTPDLGDLVIALKAHLLTLSPAHSRALAPLLRP